MGKEDNNTPNMAAKIVFNPQICKKKRKKKIRRNAKRQKPSIAYTQHQLTCISSDEISIFSSELEYSEDASVLVKMIFCEFGNFFCELEIVAMRYFM